MAGFMMLIFFWNLSKSICSKKDNGALLAGLLSLLLLGFGLYLWIKNGITLDYGTQDIINKTRSELMFKIGIISVLFSLIFILVSIFKFIIWKIKKHTTKAKKS